MSTEAAAAANVPEVHPKAPQPPEEPGSAHKQGAAGAPEPAEAPPLGRDRPASPPGLHLEEVERPRLGPDAPAVTAPRVSQEEAHARAGEGF